MEMRLKMYDFTEKGITVFVWVIELTPTGQVKVDNILEVQNSSYFKLPYLG